MLDRIVAFFMSIIMAICGFFGIDLPYGKDNPPAENFADKLVSYAPEDRNYMMSPLSIRIAFAMLANGAKGETREQILDVIGVDDLEAYNKYVSKLIKTYGKTDLLKLNISNSLWLNRDYDGNAAFNKSFTDTLSDYYNAESGIVNNATALPQINGWVAEKTENRIREIIDDPVFLCCLLNAIYFKASWANQFQTYNTKPDTFNSKDGSKKKLDFMNITESYSYYEDRHTQIVEVPYATYDDVTNVNAGFDVSMYLILTDKEVNPAELIEDTQFGRAEVFLSIPKFETEYDVKLNDTLKSMGMVDVFDSGKADISGMLNGTGNRPYVSDALHKTFIKVDENGTEAAAVTAIISKETAIIGGKKAVFKADRPFTYVIKDNTNNEVLFVGEFAFA